MSLEEFLCGAEKALFNKASDSQEAHEMVNSFDKSLRDGNVSEQKRKEWFRKLRYNLQVQKNEILDSTRATSGVVDKKRRILEKAIEATRQYI